MGSVSNGTQHNHVKGAAGEIDKTETLQYRLDNVQLLQGHHFPADSLNCSIFKVPNHLRQIKGEAYDPLVLSIGPYHSHDKDNHHFKAMEEHKLRYLKLLLQRRKEESVGRYVTALEHMEPEARRFYSEPLDHFKGDSFAEMMVLDGCFIIELIRKKEKKDNDHLLTHFNFRTVMRDLLLVENQLPFSVLSKLFKMTLMPIDEAKDFTKMAIRFFSEMMPGPQIANPENAQDIISPCQENDIKHLLGLLHDNWLGPNASRGPYVTLNISPPVDATPPPPKSPDTSSSSGELRDPLLKKEENISNNRSESESSANALVPKQDGKWLPIRSATKLYKAGINFEKVSGKRLFDIEFKDKVLWIPTLKIDDDTESILRNLVAYEQCCKGISSKRFTDYITFMDCLINTRKDVELLFHRGVIDNRLGDHQVVATIFNSLRSSVLISQEDFSYAEHFKKINNHCKIVTNVWMASLRHDYFSSPWALISFIAAVLLLLLTVVQTLYTVFAYYL